MKHPWLHTNLQTLRRVFLTACTRRPAPLPRSRSRVTSKFVGSLVQNVRRRAVRVHAHGDVQCTAVRQEAGRTASSDELNLCATPRFLCC